MIDIKNADKDVNDMYSSLIEIANDVIKKYSYKLDDIVKQLSKGIDQMSNSQLRDAMAMLCIESYNISIAREQSTLKQLCAQALYKEGIAKSFNSNSGTVEARKNQSVIDTLDKQAVSILYETISDLFKAKTDEAHRLVSAINGILISRSADAKLAYNPRSEDTNNIEFCNENIF